MQILRERFTQRPCDAISTRRLSVTCEDTSSLPCGPLVICHREMILLTRGHNHVSVSTAKLEAECEACRRGERHSECIIAQVWKTNRERSGDNMSRSARDIINRVPFPSQKCLVRTINYLVTGNIRNKLPFLSQGQAERTPGVERVTAQWSWATCGYHSRSRRSVRATPAKQT